MKHETTKKAKNKKIFLEMVINEKQQEWQKIISEELHVTDKSKLNWMSRYAMIHEIKEGLQTGSVSGGIYSTPLNTMGMGNPMMPIGVAGADGFNANGVQGAGIGNTGADFHNPNYINGSGDIPMSTLNMALEVAAMTIGFELVPVIPSTGPWAMLQFMDFPYAGGKLGRINETSLDGKGDGAENKPIYVKFNLDYDPEYFDKAAINQGDTVTVTSANGVLTGKFLAFSRINNDVIIKVVSCVKNSDNVSIADVFSVNISEVVVGSQTVEPAAKLRPELVNGSADHIQEFGNFYGDGQGGSSDDPMTRAQNETGVGNTIGARSFSKLIQMGSYEVTGSVTRQQLQDLPLYGIDVVGKVLEQMQNELSQDINNRILDRVFRLGVTNAWNQKKYQGVDLNLFFGNAANPSKDLTAFSGYNKFKGVNNEDLSKWGAVPSAVDNTNYENVTTHQRRIMSRMLAAANLIAVVSRRGRGSWAVANAQIISALQDCAGFVVAPMQNTLTQDGSQSLYFAGSLAGLNLYCDPYMLWDDTRICVGRKSDGATPGVIFMPYILCDTVTMQAAEGTFAPKMLCNSRFAIVDAGFYPEQSYVTFMVDSVGSQYLI